jgi:biotin carboxyl carrier protein
MRVLAKGTGCEEEVTVLASKDGELQVQVGEERVSFALTPQGGGAFELSSEGVTQGVYVMRDKKGVIWIHDGSGAYAFELPEEGSSSADEGKDKIMSPTPGKIVAIHVSVGDSVSEGDTLVVLEAMKMEQRLSAEVSGTVAEVLVEEQEHVDADVVLVRIDVAEVKEA